MSTEKRTRRSDLFKREVVMFYHQNELTMREVAERFEISCGMVSKWVQLLSDELEKKPQTIECEINRLNTEVKNLREEVQVLRQVIQKQFLAGCDFDL